MPARTTVSVVYTRTATARTLILLILIGTVGAVVSAVSVLKCVATVIVAEEEMCGLFGVGAHRRVVILINHKRRNHLWVLPSNRWPTVSNLLEDKKRGVFVLLSFVLGFVLSERVDRHPAFAAEDENMARSTPLIRVALSLHDVLTEGTGVLVESLTAWVVEA